MSVQARWRGVLPADEPESAEQSSTNSASVSRKPVEVLATPRLHELIHLVLADLDDVLVAQRFRNACLRLHEIGVSTRALARQAHDDYRPLVRSYSRGGYTSRVEEITRRQLNRAANVLADLIRALTGVPPARP